MPNHTDPLTSYRVRHFEARQRRLSAHEAELRRELADVEHALRATAAVIRALTLPDESDSRPHVVYTDGGSRGHPRQAAAAYVVLDASGAVVAERAQRIGHASCNEAEWRAVLLGLERALVLGIRRLELRSDSQLVVYQLAGRHRVRAAKLKTLHAQAVTLVARFEAFRAVHVPRSENKRADALANAALTAPKTEAA